MGSGSTFPGISPRMILSHGLDRGISASIPPFELQWCGGSVYPRNIMPALATLLAKQKPLCHTGFSAQFTPEPNSLGVCLIPGTVLTYRVALWSVTGVGPCTGLLSQQGLMLDLMVCCCCCLEILSDLIFELSFVCEV